MERKKFLNKILMDIYTRLYNFYGPQHWWPGETPFEIIVGAILTQSTNWKNVEKAINNLKEANLLSPEKLHLIPTKKLETLIRPSGYYRAKAKKLKSFLSYLFTHYGGKLELMVSQPLEKLREELLSVYGLGEETVDSILLYAGDKPIFVVDAYTKRTFSRLGLITERANYKTIQKMFMNNLPADSKLFNEYHALLVAFGKKQCKKEPLCLKNINCILQDYCKFYKNTGLKERKTNRNRTLTE